MVSQGKNDNPENHTLCGFSGVIWCYQTLFGHLMSHWDTAVKQ